MEQVREQHPETDRREGDLEDVLVASKDVAEALDQAEVDVLIQSDDSHEHGDDRVVGPAYKDVAAKYAGQKDAAAKLEAKVLKGGSGVWGPVPMPANAQVNPDEAKKLVAWILAQK